MSREHLTKIEEQSIALAGIFQSCSQMQKLANTGQIDSSNLAIAITAIINTEPDNALDFFHNIENIHVGLELVQQQLGTTKKERDMQLTRYSIGILFLASKLLKNPPMLQKLSAGIEKAREQIELFGIDHINIYASLGGLYSDTVSTLNPRIMVSGEPNILNNPDTASKVRTLLLCAIRCAVLWQQLGGSRWQLLFKRKKIVSSAQQLVG